MSKLQNMRVIEIPPFRAVSSGPTSFAEVAHDNSDFSKWRKSHGHLLRNLIYAPAYFLWHEGNQSVCVVIWAVRDDVTEADTKPYDIITFEGGMYLVATCDSNDAADTNETVGCMLKWVEESTVFQNDERPDRRGMYHMLDDGYSGAIGKALGIEQMEIFIPLKFR